VTSDTTTAATGSTPTNSASTCGAVAQVDCVDPRVARSRRAVLEAATDLLVESGARAVTVDAVSERSGVAKSTMYRHWESRTALLVDVVGSNIPELPGPDPELGFETGLRVLVHEVAEALGTPEWAALMPALMTLKQQVPELRELSEGDTERKIGVLADVLERGVAEGALPADLDPWTVGTVLIGPVIFSLVSGRLAEVHDVAEFAVERFLASYRT